MGHVTEYIAQVLVLIMWPGEIVWLDAVCTGKPRNVPEDTFGRGIEIPCIYKICSCKKAKY